MINSSDPNEKPSSPENKKTLEISAPTPEAISSISADAAGKIEQLQEELPLPEGHGLEGEFHQKVMMNTLAFLENSSIKALKDIEDVAESISGIQADLMMDGKDENELVEQTFKKLDELRRQTYLEIAKSEVDKENPDLLIILNAVQGVMDSKVSAASETTQKEAEIVRLKIKERNLTHPVYELMIKTATVLEGTIDHVADPSIAKLLATTAASLRTGERELNFSAKHIASVSKRLGTDTGKIVESLDVIKNAISEITRLQSESTNAERQ
jgi:hypothetical protein